MADGWQQQVVLGNRSERNRCCQVPSPTATAPHSTPCWGAGTHPAEGHHIEGVFPPVNGIQKLRLRTLWAAVELQLAHGAPGVARDRVWEELSPVPCSHWAKGEEGERKGDRQENPAG